MMNDPFSRSYFNQQPSRSDRPFPVKQTQRRSSPKVVSVPVHFVSSEQPPTTMSMLEDSAARKIQRVCRGFLVRKSVRKIASIRNEVGEVERRIDDIEVVEMIRRDAKERLRVNETLMSLLFKLDSIRGVDCGVRDLRKAVTKKAIALQEKVDSIALADQQAPDSPNNDSVGIEHRNDCTSDSEQATKTSGLRDEVVDNNSGNMEAVKDDGESGVVKEVVKEIVEDHSTVKDADGYGVDVSEVGKEQHTEVQKDRGNRELLEMLMADNEKMMKVMMQIFEKNEMQTRMLNSLSRRVEQLEKAFMSEKLRKKNKRHVA